MKFRLLLPLMTIGCARDFETVVIAQLDKPWAMTFLDEGQMLVTQKTGELLVVTTDGDQTPITGVPGVDYGGQGGLGDVITHPNFNENGWIYVSFVEPGEGDTRGAAIARARLDLDARQLTELSVIWRQGPKVSGRGHYAHRMAFGPEGHLFVSSGDRQLQTPAQDRTNNLGAILRLSEEGRAPEDNPFFDEGGMTAEIWSYGHRNPLGLAFDADGVLWEHEMGPRGGDEFQRIERGQNYGWPTVSDGDNYDGSQIPDHDTRPDFRLPEESWNPVISPSGLIIYTGTVFPDWQGQALMGGLSSASLIRVSLDCEAEGRTACESKRTRMDNRIREIEQGPDGAVWVLEDGQDSGASRLLKLVPKR